MIKTKVILTDQEQDTARRIGQARHEMDRAAGVRERKISKRCPLDINIEGMAGEIAFCKLFGLMPDLHVRLNSVATDPGDCILNGIKIDIKTAQKPYADLLVPIWKKDTGGAYALMIGTMPRYWFMGFMSSYEILQPDMVIDLGYGPTYAARQQQLYELDELMQRLNDSTGNRTEQ